jgi:hypothetical protein
MSVRNILRSLAEIGDLTPVALIAVLRGKQKTAGFNRSRTTESLLTGYNALRRNV